MPNKSNSFILYECEWILLVNLETVYMLFNVFNSGILILCNLFLLLLLRRAVAQRCPVPPMQNLISVGGQHQGNSLSLPCLCR